VALAAREVVVSQKREILEDEEGAEEEAARARMEGSIAVRRLNPCFPSLPVFLRDWL
jgi:hypothetical protein